MIMWERVSILTTNSLEFLTEKYLSEDAIRKGGAQARSTSSMLCKRLGDTLTSAGVDIHLPPISLPGLLVTLRNLWSLAAWHAIIYRVWAWKKHNLACPDDFRQTLRPHLHPGGKGLSSMGRPFTEEVVFSFNCSLMSLVLLPLDY